MTLSHINWLAVLVSAIAAFLISGFWFSPKAFYPIWWKAKGRNLDEIPGSGMKMGTLFGSSFVALLVQSTVMASLIQLLRTSGSSTNFGALQGATLGLIVGIGIAAASSLAHRLFGQDGFKVWAMEVGNDILNLIAIGAILALWR